MVKKLYPDAKLPTKATPGSMCYDVYAQETFGIQPMYRNKIGTGLAFELPEGLGLDIRPRSGLASSGLIMLNAPGTLDSDYRGELFISIMNLTGSPWQITKGDRIAQIRVMEDPWHHTHHYDSGFEEVEELSETERGGGGFGSTGN